jgi:sodium-dependent dicarboxylate transporter 2/3/5
MSTSAPNSVGFTGERKKQVFGLILGVAGLLFTLIVPPPSDLAPTAWKTIGISFLMAIWWMFEAVPIAVTSLTPLVLYPFLGVMPAAKVAPNYAQDLIWLFVGGFALAYAMETWNLHRRISLLTLKICGTNPRTLLLGFLVSTGFLSAWMSNTACAALMMPIGLAIVKMVQEGEGRTEAEMKASTNFGICVMLGIAFAASIGGMATLIGTPPNAVMAGQVAKMTGQNVPFAKFMMVGTPISILLMAACWWLLPVMFPVKDLNLAHAGSIVDQELEKLGPMSKGEKLTTGVFLFTATFWILRPQIVGFLPDFTIAGQIVPMSKLVSDSTVGMLALLLCFLIPVDFKKGRMLLDASLFKKGIPWDAIILFGGGFALGAGLNESGVSEFIAGHMSALQGMPPVLVMGLMATVAMLLTQMTSNTAVAATFVPLGISMAQGLGLPPLLVAIPIALGASLAFSLPVATPPNAIVFGSGIIRVPDMFKAGMTLNIIGIVITLIMVRLLLPIAFGIQL